MSRGESGLLLIQAAAALVTVATFAAQGISVDHRSFAPQVFLCGLLYAVALHLRRQRDRVGDMVLAIAMIVSASLVLSPAQYAAASSRMPLIDPWLASADAALRVHVPSLARWTHDRPTVAVALTAAYFTLLPQFLLTPIVLTWSRQAERLREYVFHFHCCAVVTVACLAVAPAACAFQYYGFDPVLDQERFIAQFGAARSGHLPPLRFADLEGLISVPSFHVAGALMCAWSLRSTPVFALSVFVNLLLVGATFMTGAHYFVDVPVTVLLFVGSIAVWRRLRLRSLEAPSRQS